MKKPIVHEALQHLTRRKNLFGKGRCCHHVFCGPTVYNFFHIGNARPFIVFDALGYLRYRGYDVRFVNFTDIDDKLISRANETGMTLAEVATPIYAVRNRRERAA